MTRWYGQWITSWERRLAERDTNRHVRPFSWGLDWLDTEASGDPAGKLSAVTDAAVAGSDRFFSAEHPEDYHLHGGELTFTSPVDSPYPENNTVYANYFPAGAGRAVVVLPQWNSDEDGHIGLCRLMNRFGLSALRMSKAYHHRRKPPQLPRADYHCSSNLGRTIQATRQSVIDARCCVEWLWRRGYRRIGIMGTSLGSCVAFVTAAHEIRLCGGVFNHVSPYFGDVVWRGLATRHVREALDGEVSQEELRRYWSVISPATYIPKLEARVFKSLVIWTKHDLVFPPDLSRSFLRAFRPTQALGLPCGHYTVGEFPFKWIDGLAICRFLRKQL